MKKIILKKNEDYFNFINNYKEQIIVYMVNFTKTMQIRVFYDIM